MNQKQITEQIISLIDDKNKHKKQRNFFAVGLIVLITITLIIHFSIPKLTSFWYFWVPCILIWIAWIITFVVYVILVNKQFIRLKVALENKETIIANNKVKLLQNLFYFKNQFKIDTKLIVDELMTIYHQKENQK